MAVNPAAFLKMRERFQIFATQHPKVPLFVQDVAAHAIMPGTILELKVTDPSGKNYVTNMRLTPEDVETLSMLKELK